MMHFLSFATLLQFAITHCCFYMWKGWTSSVSWFPIFQTRLPFDSDSLRAQIKETDQISFFCTVSFYLTDMLVDTDFFTFCILFSLYFLSHFVSVRTGTIIYFPSNCFLSGSQGVFQPAGFAHFTILPKAGQEFSRDVPSAENRKRPLAARRIRR